MWDAHTRRNPLFVLRSVGKFLLRYAARALISVLFQDPPRNTRRRVADHPTDRMFAAGAAILPWQDPKIKCRV